VLQHLRRLDRQLGAHRRRAVVRRGRRQVFRRSDGRTTATAVVTVVATHLLVSVFIDVSHVLVLLLIESSVVAH